MAGMDGLEGLKRIRQIDPRASVVMISGHATIQTAVEATQLGAYDILEKPLDTDRILVLLRNALQHLDPAGGERAAARNRSSHASRSSASRTRFRALTSQDREGRGDAGARADHR
jgi:DNA-binding NtrC family response regulator